MTDTATSAPAEQDRQVRTCDGCGQSDDHPHHIIYAAVAFDDPITGARVVQDRSTSKHLDCCGCKHCGIVLASAGGKKGLDLASHIQSKPAELHAQLRAAGFEVED